MKLLLITMSIALSMVVPSTVYAKKLDKNEKLKITYKKRSVKAKRKKDRKIVRDSRCNFMLGELQDIRQNKETIGTNFSKALLVDSIDTWFKDASQDLLVKKFKNSPDKDKTIVLMPKISRLYSYAQSNIYGVVALKLDVVVEDKIVDTRRYRGLGSTINWNNGSHEYVDAVDASISKALPKVVADLYSICESSFADVEK